MSPAQLPGTPRLLRALNDRAALELLLSRGPLTRAQLGELTGLSKVIEDFAPDEAAVEATFVNKDASATLKLGQARGVALMVPAKAGVIIAEYAPNLVKKTIVGAGHAEKRQIHAMIRILLPKADPRSDDAADALAIAICHANHRGQRERMAKSE